MQVKDLKPAGYNPRKISKEKLASLKKSLEEFGDLSGIVYNTRTQTLIGGHQRIKNLDPALKIVTKPQTDPTGTTAAGYIETPHGRLTYREVDWPEIKEKQANIAANQHGGEFDDELLAELLKEIKIEEPLLDFSLVGFNDDEMAGLLGETEQTKDAEPQIDRAEELNKTWGVKTGDLWQIGEHRLLCGDSTKKEDVGRVMGEEKADAIIADPPYGMRLDADFSGMVNNLQMAKEKGLKSGRKYNNVIGDHEDFDARPVIDAIGDPSIQFWFGADYYSSTLPDSEHSGAWLVWDKRLDESADKMFGSCFELIWSRNKCKRDIIRIKWAGVFGTEKEPQRGRQHPNQKPVALLTNLAERTEGIIVDPFLGSGTTMVACQNLNRKCRGIEISPDYCAVILQRMFDAFGIKGVRVE